MDFSIISQGQRLREIRKKLGLKQEELTGDSITRNLISMIETDKATLTKKAADIIYVNLKHYIKDNSNRKIDISEIYITEEEQAIEIKERFLIYIEDVGVKAEGNLQKMIDILNKYNLNREKIEIYFKIANEFKNIRNYEKAYKFYNLALEFAIMTKEEEAVKANIIITMTHCCNRLGRYEDGVKLCERKQDNISLKKKLSIIYNKVVMLKKLNRLQESIMEINKVKKEYGKELKNTQKLMDFEILKANCLNEQGNYNRAMDTYVKLYEKYKDESEFDKYSILLLGNIVELKLKLGEVSEYLEELIIRINQDEDFENYTFSHEICKVVAEALSKSDNFESREKFKKYMIEAIELAKKSRDMLIIEDVLELGLSEAYKYDDILEINKIKDYILELYKFKLISKNSNVIMKLIGFYLVKEEYSKIKSVVDFCSEKVS